MTFIYFDTNVLRYFGQAFKSAQLESNLRSRIAVSPLSVAEILAQVKVRDAYNDIKAIWNWLEPTNAHALDWPEEFIREHVFGIPTPMAAPLPQVFKKLNECLQSNADLPSFQRTAKEITKSWKENLRKSAEVRRSNIELLRSHDVKDPRNLMLDSSLKTLRSIADVTDAGTDRDEILRKLSAYHALDLSIIGSALKDHNFNFLSKKRTNDLVDLEQLVYLADDRARYLSSDKVYKRLKVTPQWPRIRLEEDPSRLMDAASATAILKQMLE